MHELAPPGYETVQSDVAWDARYLQLEGPERVWTFDEFGEDAAGPSAFSPVAITSPFRVLSDEGAEILQRIADELRAVASGTERVAKRTRGVLYRSAFVRGLYTDSTFVGFLRGLAQAPIEPHPATHHALQFNYAPDDLSINVDQWHRDVVSFDIVMIVSDPAPMRGGRFEYFSGSVEEGALLLEGDGLPSDRVHAPVFPARGWAILQQGHRVLHRAARLEEPYPRITMVASYYTPHPTIPDPTDLRTLRKADGREIALVEWSRYTALVAARKLQRFAETDADFSRPLEEVREALRAAVVDVEVALDEFESDDEGQLISFGAGN